MPEKKPLQRKQKPINIYRETVQIEKLLTKKTMAKQVKKLIENEEYGLHELAGKAISKFNLNAKDIREIDYQIRMFGTRLLLYKQGRLSKKPTVFRVWLQSRIKMTCLQFKRLPNSWRVELKSVDL